MAASKALIVRPDRFVAGVADRARIFHEQVARLIVEKLALVNTELEQRDWLVGDEFGPADALLATTWGWVQRMRLQLSSLGRLQANAARCRVRPAFARAIERHGIVPNVVGTTAAAALLGVVTATRAE
jgi:glutathione S-transferase